MKISRTLTWLLALPLALALLVPVVGCKTTKAQKESNETAAPPEDEEPGTNPDPTLPDAKPKRKPPGKTVTAD